MSTVGRPLAASFSGAAQAGGRLVGGLLWVYPDRVQWAPRIWFGDGKALRPSDIESIQVSKPTASIVRGSTATIRTVDGEVKLVCVDPDGLEASIRKILG